MSTIVVQPAGASSSTAPVVDDFTQVLLDDEARAALKDLLCESKCEHHLVFYEEVTRYKQIESTNESEIKARSAKIYDEYVRVGAHSQINLTEHPLQRIRTNLATPTLTLFDEASSICLDLIRVTTAAAAFPCSRWRCLLVSGQFLGTVSVFAAVFEMETSQVCAARSTGALHFVRRCLLL